MTALESHIGVVHLVDLRRNETADMAAQGIGWEAVLATREEELATVSEEEVDGLYAFLLTTPFNDTSHVRDPESLLKILRVVQAVFRVCVCMCVGDIHSYMIVCCAWLQLKDREAQDVITALEHSQQEVRKRRIFFFVIIRDAS